MKEKCDYRIPAQGSISNINPDDTRKREALAQLIVNRIEESDKHTYSGDIEEFEETETSNIYELDEENLEDMDRTFRKRTHRLKKIDSEETLEKRKTEEQKIEYESNKQAQGRANNNHQQALFALANELKDHGFDCWFRYK